jgi:hypothetical protein
VGSKAKQCEAVTPGARKLGALRLHSHDLGGECCVVCSRVQGEGDPQITVVVWNGQNLDADDCEEIAALNMCRRCAKRLGRMLTEEAVSK